MEGTLSIQAAAKPTLRIEKTVARTLPEIVSKRVELLTAYQDQAYAERYRALVDKVAKEEKAKTPGRSGLAEAVAKSLTLLGVQDAQIEATSYGKERPAATGSDETAWAKNRRAELRDR